jgi:hypothetical protein
MGQEEHRVCEGNFTLICRLISLEFWYPKTDVGNIRSMRCVGGELTEHLED